MCVYVCVHTHTHTHTQQEDERGAQKAAEDRVRQIMLAKLEEKAREIVQKNKISGTATLMLDAMVAARRMERSKENGKESANESTKQSANKSPTAADERPAAKKQSSASWQAPSTRPGVGTDSVPPSAPPPPPAPPPKKAAAVTGFDVLGDGSTYVRPPPPRPPQSK